MTPDNVWKSNVIKMEKMQAVVDAARELIANAKKEESIEGGIYDLAAALRALDGNHPGKPNSSKAKERKNENP